MGKNIIINDVTCYLSPTLTVDKVGALCKISEFIETALSDYPNFEYVDFCDVNAGGIQIRGSHKEIKNYSYGSQPTIKYDFSNLFDAALEFIEMWKNEDTIEKLMEEKEFITFGEKYGWD